MPAALRPPAPAATDPVAVAEALRLSATRLARILRRQDAEALPPTLASALSSIACEGSLSLSELAAREQVAPPTITRAVDKLAARGLVTAQTDPNDRRVRHVRLSPAGRRYVQRSRSAKTAWLATELVALRPEELACLAAAAPILERLVEGGR
ncbi:MAG TPA: MarR family transcriptional regulator [Actinomycetota bacterium]|nr:MarR family transcriptional regulator [Actinomycetota bacterium]